MCPWRALADPFVAEVCEAHGWWKSGQIADRYPRGVPAAVARGVRTFDVAVNRVLAHDARKDREESARSSPPPPPREVSQHGGSLPRRRGNGRR